MNKERALFKLGAGLTGLALLGTAVLEFIQSLDGQKNGLGGEFVPATSIAMGVMGAALLCLAFKS
jgi:hypothetical protein